MSRLKARTLYICQQCGYQSVKSFGRCPGCEEWNSLVEEVVEQAATPSAALAQAAIPPALADVALDDALRLPTRIAELDRVLGGGLVPGSVTLVGGEGGMGKSTLLLSMAGSLAAPPAPREQGDGDAARLPVPSPGRLPAAEQRQAGQTGQSGGGRTVLYVSGEESLRQTKLRAARLGLGTAPIQLLAVTQLEAILEAVASLKPDILIVDSIQVMATALLQSAPGSVAQVRACAYELIRQAKQRPCALLLIGHVTKEGSLAGPKVLEHLVDTVLYFEGEPTSGFRLLRSTKNRFGATFELGVFSMTGEGLVEVPNPSELFLSHRTQAVPGTMVTVSLEGTRPLLVEAQALTSPSGVRSE